MKKKNEHVVYLKGYVEVVDEDELATTKSLTEEDLEEPRWCLNLGFGFNYEEIPELCNTLPALELCYSMTQRFLDEHRHKMLEPMLAKVEMCLSSSSLGPIANGKIFSPGESLGENLSLCSKLKWGLRRRRGRDDVRDFREGEVMEFSCFDPNDNNQIGTKRQRFI